MEEMSKEDGIARDELLVKEQTLCIVGSPEIMAVQMVQRMQAERRRLEEELERLVIIDDRPAVDLKALAADIEAKMHPVQVDSYGGPQQSHRRFPVPKKGKW